MCSRRQPYSSRVDSITNYNHTEGLEEELLLWHHMPPKIAGFLGAFRSLGILSTFMKAQKLADQGLSFKVNANVPIMEHRCRSTFRTLDQNHFSRLIKQVKENDKSIHGLISSAMLNTLLLDCKNSGRLEKFKHNLVFW
jgi:hypothetical protein